MFENIKFVNLTTKPIRVVNEEDAFVIKPSGKVATVLNRVKQVVGKPGFFTYTILGDIKGIPEPEDGVIYIVTPSMRFALGESRPDVVAPLNDYGVRDPNGHVVSVPGFFAGQESKF